MFVLNMLLADQWEHMFFQQEPDMKEAEVEGAEAMAGAVEGWVAEQGLVGIKQ